MFSQLQGIERVRVHFYGAAVISTTFLSFLNQLQKQVAEVCVEVYFGIPLHINK